MSKPTERLFLSTVAMQTDGSARTPSQAFLRARLLLGIEPEQFDTEAIGYVLDRPIFEKEATKALTVPPYPYGTTLSLSQSAIQTFLRCPYRYYSTYQLKLREQKDSRPGLADDGTFLHYVFEQFLRASLTEDGHLQIPPPEEIAPLADRIVSKYLGEVCPIEPERMDKRLLHIFARLQRLSLIMLRDILGELQYSRFVPARFEQRIGRGQGETLPTVELDLKNGSRVILSGVIDRVDLYEGTDQKLYVRVVDYKSGTHRFRLEDVRTGMDIQLILYLFAVLSSNRERFAAGGAQYLYATNEKGKIGIGRSGFLLESEEMQAAADTSEGAVYSKKLEKLKANDIDALAADMKTAVASVAERILAGEAQKTPSAEACQFCPVRTHCDQAYH